MALGNTYNNNQNSNKTFSPTIYSKFGMSNPDSKVDATALGFSFWKNTLKVSISPKKQNTNTDYAQFDRDNGIAVNLTHTKAYMLAHEIRLFMTDPEKYSGSGVTSGNDGVITISDGREIGSTNPCLIIRKVDENGTVQSSFAYEFKTDYHYAVRGYIGKDLNKTTEDYKSLEIEEFLMVLDEYVKAMTNAQAFAVVDQMHYNVNQLKENQQSIMEKLGIDIRSNGGSGRGYNSNSFFNKPQSSQNPGSNVTFNSGSMDDLDAQY